MDYEKGILRRYRSAHVHLKIGSKEYVVLDTQLAKERAHLHLKQALYLLNNQATSHLFNEINKELLLATDFGCKEAPFILAQQILKLKESGENHWQEESIYYLKIAAQRGHAEAAYRIGCSYAGIKHFPDILEAGKHFFAHCDGVERSNLAIYYLSIAVDYGHQSAIEELIMSYAYGQGFIPRNKHIFIALCEQLVVKNNQSIMIGYGAWLMGRAVDGSELSADLAIPINLEKAYEYLLRASIGPHLQLAQRALNLLCVGINQGVWGNRFKLKKKLSKAAHRGYQLLALYLGWYSISPNQRVAMPNILDDYPLEALAKLVEIDKDNALSYLNAAFFGVDEDLASLAKHILSCVFGQCFLNEEGRLILDRHPTPQLKQDEIMMPDRDVAEA